MPREGANDIWKYHLLNTADYSNFCQGSLIRGFIHRADRYEMSKEEYNARMERTAAVLYESFTWMDGSVEFVIQGPTFLRIAVNCSNKISVYTLRVILAYKGVLALDGTDRLLFKGKLLENPMSLKSYEIGQGSKIDLLPL